MICPHCHQETEEKQKEFNVEPVIVNGKEYKAKRVERIGVRRVFGYGSGTLYLRAVPIVLVEEVKK